MITTSDFKKGSRFELDGAPWQILDVTVHNPSARGSATLVKVKVRNLMTDQVLQKSFKSGESFEEPDLSRIQVQYLYEEGSDIVFMENETYEQFNIPKSKIESAIPWLSDGFELQLLKYSEEIINIELPPAITVAVRTVEAGEKGDTASGKVLSRAILENGISLMVPTYVKEGSQIKVDPSSCTFLSRA